MLRFRVSFCLYTMLSRSAGLRLSEDKPQPLAPQPGDGDGCLVEPGGYQQRVVSALLELHHDLRLGDRDLGRGIDEVAEQVAGLGDLVSVADADAQQAIEAAGHQRQLPDKVELQPPP